MNDLFSYTPPDSASKPSKTTSEKHEPMKLKSSSKDAYSAKDIEVLEGLEPVRKRPGMYIGGTDITSMHHLISEVLDNSMDEVVAGHATEIKIHLSKDNIIEISDNGRGIPVDEHPKYPGKSALEIILTVLHSGGKFSDKAYATSGGLHGVGISVVNALSENLVVEVSKGGKIYRQEYSKGKPLTELKPVGKTAEKGTKVTFKPDVEIFGNLKFNAERIYRLARAKAYLTKAVHIKWSCDPELIDANSQTPDNDDIYFKNGIRDYLNERAAELVEPIGKDYFFGEADLADKKGKVEFVILWQNETDALNSSYCNTIPTPLGGTHETGFRSALTKSIKEYGDKIASKRAEKITGEDVFAGSYFVLSVFIKNPQFQGQTKEKLVSNDAAKLVENALRDKFDNLLAQNPQIAAQLVDFIATKAEERLNRRLKKDAERKTLTSKLRLPGKLADCISTDIDETELFIVEGDSAGGSAKQARDRNTQAILPIRGKILNVASATEEKILANQEIKDLITALGCGVGERFNEANLRYGKIIIMTDADVDGAHIASLLMTFFYRQMRGLLENKRLYLAVPPLYRITIGDKTTYIKDDKEKDKFLSALKESDRKKAEIGRFKGLGEMMAAQLKETTMDKKKRGLIQVSVDSFQATDDLVEDLMGKKPEKRFQFIQNNSDLITKLASELDI
ncbi:MAG TPA: DNA topoisomerase IV subunit B [Alphaproteobacteria bacterium]|nr:DNA topoisomerase IV subunit B [Alphaproteobacteria bacterium]